MSDGVTQDAVEPLMASLDAESQAKAVELGLTESDLAVAMGKEAPEVAETPSPAPSGQVESQEPEQDVVADSGLGGGTDAAETADWVTPDVLELAGSYGLGKDDLADFSGEQEFRRAAAFADRQLMTPAKELTPAVSPPAAPDAAPTPQEIAELAKIDPALFEEAEYDELTMNLVKSVRQMQDRLEEQAKHLKESQQFQETVNKTFYEKETADRLNYFHDCVDQMDQDRYGRSVDDAGRVVDVTDAEQVNRKKLWEAADLLMTGIIGQARRAGQEPKLPSLPSLLMRAEQIAFADDLRNQDRRKFQEAVSAQSKKRRPSAGRSRIVAPPPKENQPVDEVSAIAQHPDVLKFWEGVNS